jgi:hypothetical protein
MFVLADDGSRRSTLAEKSWKKGIDDSACNQILHTRSSGTALMLDEQQPRRTDPACQPGCETI